MPSREAAQLGVSGLGVTWQREARARGMVRGCFAPGVVHVNSKGAMCPVFALWTCVLFGGASFAATIRAERRDGTARSIL